MSGGSETPTILLRDTLVVKYSGVYIEIALYQCEDC